MALLRANTINELVKLTARRKTLLFLLLAVLIPFAGLPVVTRVQSGFGITAVSSADYPVAVLGLLTLFVVPLLIFLSVSDLFSGEFGDRTIRAMLVRPVSRLKIFTSKVLAVALLTAAQLAAGFAASAAASLLLPVSPDGRMAAIGEAAIAYAAAFVPMAAIIAAAAFAALWFRNGSGALAVCILLYAAAKLLGFFFPELAAYSPAAYTDWHLLLLQGSVPFGKLAAVFSFLLGCGIVFYTLGYYLFDKKEA